jgi:anti-anti-sigma factor
LEIGQALWNEAMGKENWLILRLKGVCCGAAVPDFTALYQTLGKPGCSGVYLDMRGVERIDLLGLNELIRTHWQLQRQGARLRILCGEDNEVYKWLKQSGLSSFIAIARMENAVAGEEIPYRKQEREGKKSVEPGSEEMKHIVPDETGVREILGPRIEGNQPA